MGKGLEFAVEDGADSAVLEKIKKVVSLDNLRDRATGCIELLADNDIKYSEGMRDYLGKLAIEATNHALDTDSLTGAKNRGYLDSSLAGHYKAARTEHDSASVLMIDIDYFKRVNDSYGHQKGDEVLRRVSEIVTKVMRDSDTFARYGGEEFLAILPNTDLAGGLILAKKINKVIARENILPKGEKLTVSIGVAELDEGDDDFSGVIGRADQALYKVKNGGRNGSGYLDSRDVLRGYSAKA
jgi:diguanylate cyclase (GGDEF)-like protein